MDNQLLKKIHAVELDLLEQFDRFCRTYDLTYFADYGTLLGAVRHRGFIPWDDDIDVCMMRPEYDRMLQYAEEYFRYPYYLQSCYNVPGSLWGLCKLINEETTCIEKRELPPGYHHGIFLDIFAMDYVYDPDSEPSLQDILLQETWLAIRSPQLLTQNMREGYKPKLQPDMIASIISMPLSSKLRLMDGMLAQAFPQATHINWFSLEKAEDFDYPARRTEWFSQALSLPFENRTIPAPAGYDFILTGDYGNYMTPRQVDNYHAGAFYDPDHPWKMIIEEREKI